jgi:hypothetical protein
MAHAAHRGRVLRLLCEAGSVIRDSRPRRIAWPADTRPTWIWSALLVLGAVLAAGGLAATC